MDQVWRQLRAMGVHVDWLDDATQEVFLIAFRKRESFDGQAKLSTWLYAITYRVGCNYRRKARRESGDELLEGAHASQQLNPEQSLAERRAAAMVQRFCDRLSKKLRDVFVLCLLEGLPARDVAELLGTTENTVYSRVRLVREAFRIELQRQETDAS
jgi:RNA polymerase sigma-70 factor (ECF subfamily)